MLFHEIVECMKTGISERSENHVDCLTHEISQALLEQGESANRQIEFDCMKSGKCDTFSDSLTAPDSHCPNTDEALATAKCRKHDEERRKTRLLTDKCGHTLRLAQCIVDFHSEDDLAQSDNVSENDNASRSLGDTQCTLHQALRTLDLRTRESDEKTYFFSTMCQGSTGHEIQNMENVFNGGPIIFP